MNLQAKIVIDLGFGDAGKGTIVDFLARNMESSTVIRFNGGSQAAHNVITPEGIHHTFSQFGSNMLTPYSRTHLSRFVLIDPMAMNEEALHIKTLGFGNPFNRTTIDEMALVITPFQKAANKLREVMRKNNKHGSCGMGIGETMSDMLSHPDMAVRAKDLLTYGVLVSKLKEIFKLKKEEFENFIKLSKEEAHSDFSKEFKEEIYLLTNNDSPLTIANILTSITWKLNIVNENYLKMIAEKDSLIFEGAQGVLIDERHGFHPYTTWSTTTFKNALILLSEIDYKYPIEKIGVIRMYQTRHGAGPFVTENNNLTKILPDTFNKYSKWQEEFRVGWLDIVMTKYALRVSGGVDSIALTHLDKMDSVPKWKLCTEYEIPKNILDSKDNRMTIISQQKNTKIVRIDNLKEKEILEDLSYQESLTSLLNSAKPVYKEITNNNNFIQTIEKYLAVPVSIISKGPKATDKSIR